MSSSTLNNDITNIDQNPIDSTESSTSGIKAFCSKWFISYKVIYFVLNMYIYAFHTVQTLLFKSKGWELSYSITGLMSTVLIGNYFGGKIWGQMADRTNKHKEIIAWTTLAYTLLGFFMCFPEYVVFSKDGFLKTRIGENFAYVAQISSGWILFFLFSFFLSSAFPLTDRLVIGMLATNPKATKDSMGIQRLFGAFGHLLISIIGLKFYAYSEKQGDDLGIVTFINEYSLIQFTNSSYGKTLIFLMQVVSSALFIGCIFFLVPKNLKVPAKKGHVVASKKVVEKDFNEEEVKDTRSPEMILLSNPSFLMFIIFILCSGLTRCVTANYGKLIIEDVIGKKGVKVIKDAEAARCVSEVLAYATAPFIKKSLGIYWVLSLSQAFSVIRMIAYGLVPKNEDKLSFSNFQYFFVLTLELIKGFTSGFISSSAIPIAHNLAPAGCETSAQTLYSGVYSGLSSGLGGLICWVYLDAFTDNKIEDTMSLNYYLGIICGLVSIVMIGKFIFVDRVMGFPGYPARKQV